MWITAYYTVWGVCGLPPEKIDWSGISHLIHQQLVPVTTGRYWNFPRAFHDDDTIYFEKGIGAGCGDQGIQEKLVREAHAHHKKVILGLGGAGKGAEAFSFISSENERLESYVAGVLNYAHQRGYDGVDVDWEFVYTRDRSNFIKLLTTLRRALDQWTPSGLLTLAIPGWFSRKYGYDIETMNSVADQINLMSYDMATPWNKYSGFNAPIGKPLYDDYDGLDIQSGLEEWIDHGLDRSKIGLGLPFFGYYWKENDAPGQRRAGDSVFQISHYEAVGKYTASRYHWDEFAKVPWLSGIDSQGKRFFISYDDTASLRMKIQLAKEHQLGGIMVFELWRGVMPASNEQPLLAAVRDATWGREIIPSQVVPPKPLFPIGGVRNISLDPTLRWTKVDGAMNYSVEYSQRKSFSDAATQKVSGSDTTLHLENLHGRMGYFWKVRSHFADTASAWSRTERFETLHLKRRSSH